MPDAKRRVPDALDSLLRTRTGCTRLYLTDPQGHRREGFLWSMELKWVSCTVLRRWERQGRCELEIRDDHKLLTATRPDESSTIEAPPLWGRRSHRARRPAMTVAPNWSTDFWVLGRPVPQGSMRPMVSKTTGRAFAKHSNEERLIPWRTALALQARKHAPLRPLPKGTPIVVDLAFVFVRPKCHFHRGFLRADAPKQMTDRPDIDKCVRAIFDALTKTFWADDCTVVGQSAWKTWSTNDQEGVRVRARVHQPTAAGRVA